VAGHTVRLGVYADLVYRANGDRVSTDLSFVEFVAGLATRIDELVVFGRLEPEPGEYPYALPPQVRFVPLPHYPSVAALRGVARAVRRSRAIFASELETLDAVWLFGPHPLTLEFVRVARRRRPVFLGIRQDFPRYIWHRLPHRGWLAAMPGVYALDWAFRRLARRLPTVVVGNDLARAYARGPAPVFVTGFSLIRSKDVVAADDALSRSWAGPLRVVSVGRIDPEKNPFLLPEILADLRARDPRWRLTAVGSGRLEAAVAERARELGVADALELAGYVPAGPELWEEYRRGNVFLHVSLTEGVPQVLFEAQAAGTPIVATDVGGVRSALEDGRLGRLVPPNDAAAAAEQVDALRLDLEARRRLVIAGLEHARRETMDAQLDRIVDFFRRQLVS
jgi:glycosyltransferase involved in cell wall biosynthesis